jgi:hypothetical protein
MSVMTAVALLIGVAVPLLSLGFYVDKLKGVLYLGAQLILSHILIGFTLLNFKSLVAVNALVLHFVFWVLVVFWHLYKRHIWQFPKPSWILIVSALIMAAALFQIHYNYHGAVSFLTQNYKTETHYSYPYPYLSDEWLMLGFEREVITKQELPFTTPFNNNPYPNVLAPFFVLFAEIVTFFSFDPVSNFGIIVVVSGILIALSVFVFLRCLGVSNVMSSLAMVFLLYIPNGSNFPALWNFIPFHLATALFFLGWSAFISGHQRLGILYLCVTLFIYPPYIIIFVPVALFVCKGRWKIIVATISAVCATLLLLGFIEISLLRRILGFIGENFYRPIVGRPILPPWETIPFFILPFALLGLHKAFGSLKQLFWPTMVVYLVWAYGFFTHFTLVIAYERVVLLAVIISIVAAVYYFDRFNWHSKGQLYFYGVVCLITVILIATNLFTFTNPWKNIHNVSQGPNTEDFVTFSTPPVNNYYNREDIDIFKDLKGKRFLSHPWKGLILGVVTDNVPLETKLSTVAVKEASYQEFIKASCTEKEVIAEEKNIEYVYVPAFSCDAFIPVATSSEKFILYKFVIL